ncbi:MAG: hypothetical protein H6Q20_339 [Bacteroidetes bacterium]|nr:hypothetical protein [Bacteroidota bacterium]
MYPKCTLTFFGGSLQAIYICTRSFLYYNFLVLISRARRPCLKKENMKIFKFTPPPFNIS